MEIDIVSLLEQLRYVATVEDDGEIHVRDIVHQFRWRGYEDRFWSVMAPYIKDGGFIVWFGEDGQVWEYVFEQGKLHEKMYAGDYRVI